MTETPRPPSRLSIPLDAVVGTAVGWAVSLVSTSVEVWVARERARGLETRRSRKPAFRALCRAARRCQCRQCARFGRILAAMRFLLLLRVRALFLQQLCEVLLWAPLVWVFAALLL